MSFLCGSLTAIPGNLCESSPMGLAIAAVVDTEVDTAEGIAAAEWVIAVAAGTAEDSAVGLHYSLPPL